MTTDERLVAVLGAGNMGTALAQVIASNGHTVNLWSIEHDVLEEIRDHRRNTKYLEGIELQPKIVSVWDLGEAVHGAHLVVVSVPSQVVGKFAPDLAPHLVPGQAVLNVAKGLDGSTHRRMSETLVEALGDEFAATTGSMGGPAIAVEMARGQPMAVVIGIPDPDACRTAKVVLHNDHLKVETISDVAGLELCSTLKNVYAIALGMCDGLGFGTNTKASLTHVALAEMGRIARALGGRSETAFGLAGLGDLITTGFSAVSRNRTLGEKLAGGGWQEFLAANTVEGVPACAAIGELIEPRGLDVPLFALVHGVVQHEQPAGEAMTRFLREFSY
jgi:glycerol-3-phosphate dehydrogenase (NAD(P)+)